MVMAPILPARRDGLAVLLATMNVAPGRVDPDNAVFPFARFEQLHLARFVILDDQTLADRPPDAAMPDAPVYLAFLGDCDGDAGALLALFAAQAAPGLRAVFSHCAGFDETGDLLRWMQAHAVRPAAQYVNWVGRTVGRIREEVALYDALRAQVDTEGDALLSLPPREARERLVAWYRQAGPVLTQPAPTPVGWQLRHIGNLIGVPVALLLLSPLLLVGAIPFLLVLRRRETTDPVIAPPPAFAHQAAIAATDDYDVTNPFSAIGNVKPGLFRIATLRFVFWLLQFSTRQFYTGGRLARVGTIHFARWVFLDERRRVFFASNYDGSLDSYMDDFINKVAFGLNLVFSNGIGYPRTRFLLIGGASVESLFKNFLRRRAVPTQVWYKAYPGVTAADLARNALLREGLEAPSMTTSQARQWLALI